MTTDTSAETGGTDMTKGVEKIYRNIGKRVCAARLDRCMTQQELANRVRLSRAAIASIETGRQRVMLHHLPVFTRALKTTTFKLLKGLVL